MPNKPLSDTEDTSASAIEQSIVLRYDSTSFSTKPKKTSQGFLKAFANLSRTGVFTYFTKEGAKRRELRLPEEVFNPLALSTLESAPITFGHPIEDSQQVLININNAKKFSVGMLSDQIHTGEKFISASLIVTDPKAIEAVEKGHRREVSLGYQCNIENTSGVWNGETYDCIQRDIIYNHVAIVPKGRAGSEVSIRMDANDAMTEYPEEPIKETKMENKKIRLDGVDFELTSQAAQAVEKMLAKHDLDMSAIKAEFETAKGQLDAVKADLAKAEQARMDAEDPSKLQAAITARVELLSKAKKILGEGAEIDGLSDRKIKEAVISKVNPEMKFDDAEDGYVNGGFDHIVSSYKSKAESLATARTAVDAVTKGAGDVKKLDSATMRELTMKKWANAWKQPVNK